MLILVHAGVVEHLQSRHFYLDATDLKLIRRFATD
jgi:hypothetical protein